MIRIAITAAAYDAIAPIMERWAQFLSGEEPATAEVVPLAARPSLTAWSASRSRRRPMTRSAPRSRSAAWATRPRPTSGANATSGWRPQWWIGSARSARAGRDL